MRSMWAGLMAGAVLLSACSYRFAGGDSPPFGIQRISVLMFENRTSEIGVESIFTNDLIEALTDDGRMSVVPLHRARGVFRGAIERMHIDTVSRRNSTTALERRITVTLDISFEERGGAVLWSQRGLQRSETYGVSPDKRTTEMNRRAAVSKISLKTAQDIYQILMWERRVMPQLQP